MRKSIAKIADTYQKAHALSHRMLQVGLSISSALLIAGLLLTVQGSNSPIFLNSVVSSVFDTSAAVTLVSFLFFFLSDYIIKKDT